MLATYRAVAFSSGEHFCGDRAVSDDNVDEVPLDGSVGEVLLGVISCGVTLEGTVEETLPDCNNGKLPLGCGMREILRAAKVEAVLPDVKATPAMPFGGELVERPVPLDDAGDELDARDRRDARRCSIFVALRGLRRARGGFCLRGKAKLLCSCWETEELEGAFLQPLLLPEDTAAIVLRLGLLSV